MRHVVDVVVALREEEVGLIDRLDVVEMDAEEDLLDGSIGALNPDASGSRSCAGGKKSFFGGRMVTS
jgi:hypothetical protein